MIENCNVFLYIATCIVNLLGFMNGSAFSWSSPVLPILSSNDTNVNPLLSPISPSEGSWIVSLLSLGIAIGPIPAGYLSDRIGRINTLLVFTLPMIASHLIIIFASKVIHFCVARFLLGVGISVVYSVLPIYVGEIAEDSNRGLLGIVMSLISAVGLLFSYAVGPFVSVQLLSILSLIPALAFLVLFRLYIPESPYYLVCNGREEQAEYNLKLFRQTVCNKSHQNELEDIKRIVAESRRCPTSLVDAFKSKALRKGLTISMGVLLVQQFSGIAIVLSYMQTIFIESGASIPSHISPIIVATIQFFSVFVSLFLVDRLGRKFLLLFSAIGTSISLGALGLFFYLKSITDVDCLFWLPSTSLIVYIFAYNCGLGPVAWTLIGELFAPNVKAMASTMSACSCMLECFIISLVFPHLVDLVGMSASFWSFTALNISGIFFIIFYVPETKCKSLEEIFNMFNK